MHTFGRVAVVCRVLPIVLSAALGGCFATRSDVRIVQSDVATLRTELLRNDTEQKDALAAAVKLLRTASDSIALISNRTVSLQGDVRGEMRAVKEQLLQLQTLLGQSAATIAKMRSALEERAASPMQSTSAPLVPPVGTGGVESNPVQMPEMGPNVMYSRGLDLIRGGSLSTGRAELLQLIKSYPAFENLAEARYWVAVSFERENNVSSADAAYAAVVQTHPDSPFAASSLYKRAELFAKQGNTVRARELYTLVLSKYPRSPEAGFAADRLKQR